MKSGSKLINEFTVLAISLLIVCMSLSAAFGQVNDALVTDILAKLDKHLTDGEKTGFAGAILLVKDGKVLLHKGYGFSDCQRKTKTTGDMVFDIGSLTKPITAVAILKLQS